MSAAELVRRLEAAGCSLVLEGDCARLRGPADALTPALIAEARQHKAELVAAIRGNPGARRLGDAFVMPASCPRCGGALPPVALVGDGGPFTICRTCKQLVRGRAG